MKTTRVCKYFNKMAVIKIYSTVVVVFVIISHNQTYSEDYNSIDQNSTNQKKLKGMDSKFKVAHKATLRLKVSI